MRIGEESDGVLVGLSDALVLSDAVRSPVDVEHQNGHSQGVLDREPIIPGLVFVGPGNFIVVREFCLISLLEVFLPGLGFGLDGVVLEVPSPVVEVVVAEPHVLQARSQHIYYTTPGAPEHTTKRTHLNTP